MELVQLLYFVRIAEQGSFSKASEILQIAQPTLSRKVRELEVELRSHLFHRNGRGVQLTPSGRRFFDHAKGLLRGAESAKAAVQEVDARSGRVVAGLSPGVIKTVVPRFFEAFAEQFPNASLCVTEGLSDSLYRQLLTGRVDFAIMRNPTTTAHLVIEPIMTESLYLVGSRPLEEEGESVGLAALADLSFIMPNSPHSIRPLIDAAMASIGATLRSRFEVDSIDAVLELTVAGLGYAMIPESALTSFPSVQRLYRYRIDAPELSTTLCLVMPSRRPESTLPMETARLATQLLLEAWAGPTKFLEEECGEKRKVMASPAGIEPASEP